ncbi:MoaF-related domain-containing protein [Herbaspirillum robiniae]|uniref:MoaF-related domain-containing protein n=1 Tax=Herbaspirillum robiniae TaxID=2014887 RepID=UPI003D31E6EA
MSRPQSWYDRVAAFSKQWKVGQWRGANPRANQHRRRILKRVGFWSSLSSTSRTHLSATASIDIDVTLMGNDVYMIYWSRRPGQYVVHVDDFHNGVAYTNIFRPDGKSSRRKGTLVEVK